MINIGKVVAASRDYYLNQVADSAEEYYSAKGEMRGRWIGAGAKELGLSGEVDGGEFTSVLDGFRPGTDERLSARFANRKVLGWDITFRAPKSVSLMYAIGDDDVQQAVIEAHDLAVAEGLDYIESRATFGRIGAGGTTRVSGSGLVATAWRHRTSREADPLLHTHVVAANMIRVGEDRWVTLDGAPVHHHAHTGGFIYQAALRRELTQRLGVEWAEVVNGMADVRGMNRDVIEVFSKRRSQVVAKMSEHGGRTAQSAQAAALTTRQAKGKANESNLFDRWQDEAEAHGFTMETVGKLCGKRTVAKFTERHVEHYASQLPIGEELTRSRSHFDRRAVIEQVVGHLDATVGRDAVEQIADQWISKHAIDVEHAIRSTTTRLSASAERVLTTPEMLKLEQELVALATRDVGPRAMPAFDAGRGRAVEPQRLDALTSEQRAMVDSVTTSGRPVDVVVGDAGTGKTYALGLVRSVFESGNYRVIGVALAANAARQLEEGAAIPSGTIRGLLNDIARHGPQVLRDPVATGTVLVIDEAAMVGTRDLHALLTACASQNVKVVLVGDAKQLAAIEAGGAFQAITDRIEPSRLTVNLRQRHEAGRLIADALKAGDSERAVEVATADGSLVMCDVVGSAMLEMTDRWFRAPHRESCLMIASRRADVLDLNLLAQARRIDAGELTGDGIAAGQYEYRVGDRVLCRRRDAAAGVINGDYATVEMIDAGTGSLVVSTDRGHRATLTPQYVKDHVQLGYAITAHLAQGTTVESAFVLGTGGMSREAVYVAMTRGREHNVMFVTPRPLSPVESGWGGSAQADVSKSVARGISRSEAKTLAIDVGRDERADIREVQARRRSLEMTPPRFLIDAIGLPPDSPIGRASWSEVALAIDDYRRAWGVTETRTALGSRPRVRGRS